MKRAVFAMGLAVGIMGVAQQEASAWCKFNFATGVNIGLETSGASVKRGGYTRVSNPPPWANNQGFGGAPAFGGGGFGAGVGAPPNFAAPAHTANYGEGTNTAAPMPNAPAPSPVSEGPHAPAAIQPASYYYYPNPYYAPAVSYYWYPN